MPNGHQGSTDALLVWPRERHVPWQSSEPNELISQLETLNGGTGAAWVMGPEGEGENEWGIGPGAGCEEDEGLLKMTNQDSSCGRCSCTEGPRWEGRGPGGWTGCQKSSEKSWEIPK